MISPKIPVSVLIPAKNEEKNLPACLESVAIADEIGNGSDAAKILFGLIGNKIGNDISLKKIIRVKKGKKRRSEPSID